MPEASNGTNGIAKQILFWLLGSLASAVVVLAGVVISDNRTAIASLQSEMKERSTDRYHASEARADFAARDRRIDACEAATQQLRRDLDIFVASSPSRRSAR